MDSLGEMKKFLERNCLLRLNQEEIENINRLIQETQETWTWSLGQGYSLEKEMTTHFIIFA